jgi:hypothetical protein
MASDRRYTTTKFLPAAAGHSWMGVRTAVILIANDQPRGL